MKKKFYNWFIHFKNEHRLTQRALIMCCVMLFGFMTLAQAASPQEGKLNLNLGKTTFKEVFAEIQKQTGYIVMFNNAMLDKHESLDLNVKDASLKDVLQKILKDKALVYRVKDEFIIIEKDKSIIPAQVKEQQEKKFIKGVVTDDKGVTVLGVNVLIKGTSQGTVSDLDGNYRISIPYEGAVLIFSFVGMETKEVKVANSDVINVQLKAGQNIDEVIVTGYFNKGKIGFAGSVSTFKQEDIQKISTGNMLTTLSVLDAGFRIQESNSQGSNPNAVPDFTIRGRGSFQNKSTQPIFIVDGFQSNAEAVMDMDPNRIKSMNILKDAAATILYGSRAGNGVIVIETIAPKAGEIRVTYDHKSTFAFPDLKDYSLMNASEKLEFEELAGLHIGMDAEDQIKKDKLYNDKYKAIHEGVDTYWLSQPLENTVSQAHSLYIEGGVDKVRYGIDAAYRNDNGVMKQSGNDKFDLGFKLIYRIADKITIQNYASFSYKKKYNSPYGRFSTYTKLNPYERYKNAKGELIPNLSDGSSNPLYDASLPFEDNTIIQNVIERLNVDWTINNAMRLKANLHVNYGDLNFSKYKSPFRSEYMESKDGLENGLRFLPVERRGEMTKRDGKTLDVSGNVILNYNRQLGDHTLFFGLGGEMTYNKMDQHGFSVQGFPNDQYQDISFAMQYLANSKPISGSSMAKSVGVFFNGNYIYDDRYFIDMSIRYDGSSKFGADNKFAPFWAIGGGWNIHKEDFFNGNLFNELKLRYNYGVTGNQEFSAYQALTIYEYNLNFQYYKTIPATLKGYGNPNLKWQEQKSHNIGLDFVLNNKRIKGSLNYYKKRTTGMLADITVAPSIGFKSGTYTANLGEIENVGYEANLNAILIRNSEKDFEWGIGIQMAHNESKILEISEALKSVNDKNNLEKFVPGLVYVEGESLSTLKAVKSLGIDPATGEEVFLKKDGKTVTSIWDADDKVNSGDTEPDLFGNINTNLYYKGWNVNMVFSYALGADKYNQTVVDKVENMNPDYNGDKRALKNRWKKPGDLTSYKGIDDAANTYISSRFIQTENIFQLKTLSLSYQFASTKLKKYKIDALRLSFYANDLFRISNVEVERGTLYPFARSFGLGLNVRF